MYKVAEVFGPTFQGEGQYIGLPTLFVRFGGCGYRCSWCDSMHAVDPALVKMLPTMSGLQIVQRLEQLAQGTGVTTVVLSGGDPTIWNLEDLFIAAAESSIDFSFHVETQGENWRDWLVWVRHLTISPKPPSSFMHPNWEKIQTTLNLASQGDVETSLKFVVFNDEDFQWVQDVLLNGTLKLEDGQEVFLSAGTVANEALGDTMQRYLWLSGRLYTSPLASYVRVLPQLHVLMHGHKLGV